MNKPLPTFICVFFFVLVSLSTNASSQQSAVAMPDSYSAEISADILRRGGNAVDAAVAAAFTLAVTLPEAGNIGGGGFMLIYHQNKAEFIDYRETAPALAHRDMYLDKEGNVIPYMSLVGTSSSGVPGTVDGLWKAHKRYGTMPWKSLVEPAIKLAKDGFIIHQKLAKNIERYQNWIEDKPQQTNFHKYFASLKAGSLFKQPELANTLTRIAEAGVNGFYQGETARLLVEQMKRSGGLITLADLKSYQAKWRSPVSIDWQGYHVLSAPPPSSGGIAVGQLLTMKNLLSQQFEGVEHNSAQYIHLMSEMEKLVFADRAKLLGDPDFFPVPMKALLDQSYNAKRSKLVNPESISITKNIKQGIKESEDTTHFSIVDRFGNAVSNTYTLNLSFGSGVVVEGAGFLLNNEMDDFSAKPGVPNVFGVVGDKANEIAPGKRMLSSMSPTILLEDDKVKLVVGSPGGSTIITSVFQTIVNVIDYAMNAENAVNSMRTHHQLLPKNLIKHSVGLTEEDQNKLIKMGYKLSQRHIGDVHLVVNSKGKLDAASDANGRGKAIVIEH